MAEIVFYFKCNLWIKAIQWSKLIDLEVGLNFCLSSSSFLSLYEPAIYLKQSEMMVIKTLVRELAKAYIEWLTVVRFSLHFSGLNPKMYERYYFQTGLSWG